MRLVREESCACGVTAGSLCRYALGQQMVAPSLPVQQVNCNAVLVPSPVFSSPIMIPHNSFIPQQAQPAYPSQPQPAQHSLQLQQPQQFFQVRPCRQEKGGR